jgi:hypothetical protein
MAEVRFGRLEWSGPPLQTFLPELLEGKIMNVQKLLPDM